MHLADTTTIDPSTFTFDPSNPYSNTIPLPEPVPAGVSPDTSSSWVTDISNVLTQGLSLYGQLQIQNMNMDLIKQGKPPLTAYQVAAMAPQLNVGLASSTQNLVMYGLLGAGAVILLAGLMKQKRMK
jgi:hypothetical protein